MPTLEISKDFKSSIENLYSAWTEPEQLKQWWKPLGKQLTDVENNITEGGTVRYTCEDDSLVISGVYEKVNNHSLLEYTWNWHSNLEAIHDAAYKLSVHFEGDEENASISVSQDGFQNEESIHPHRLGWEQALKQLKSYLEGNETNNSAAGSENDETKEPATSSENPQPSVAGHNEDPEQVKVGGG